MPPSPPLSLDALLTEIELTGPHVAIRIDKGQYVEALAQLTTTEAHIAEVRRRVHTLAAAEGAATSEVLTNCDSCLNDEGWLCKAMTADPPAAAYAVRSWWEKAGGGYSRPAPGATGCPSHKARS